ncbi:MAG: hypothetical protein JNK89_04055 [Saprospiraceae bacterium]|nr:hypothetical protein [Saprospiraceae bacterium]
MQTPVLAETPVATPKPAMPQGFPAHRSRPPSNALGDWIFNHSTAAMVIVSGIIVFAILIFVLMELGVI